MRPRIIDIQTHGNTSARMVTIRWPKRRSFWKWLFRVQDYETIDVRYIVSGTVVHQEIAGEWYFINAQASRPVLDLLKSHEIKEVLYAQTCK